VPWRVKRLLFIVGESRRDFYDSLKRTFAGDDTVQVMLERRVSERRGARDRAGTSERRQSERRARREIERQIRARGYAVVGVTAFQRAPRESP
jgi:hypothetical protein